MPPLIVASYLRLLRTAVLAALTLCSGLALAEVGQEPSASAISNTGFLNLESHFSALSNQTDASVAQVTLGYGLRAGYRFEGWGAFGLIEQNGWLSTELNTGLVSGVLNVGVGAEYFFLGGHLRSLAAVGPSILLYDTEVHKAGTTGIFVDIRPLGLRWPLNGQFSLGADLLHWTVVAPVIDDPGLMLLEYRMSVYLEARI